MWAWMTHQRVTRVLPPPQPLSIDADDDPFVDLSSSPTRIPSNLPNLTMADGIDNIDVTTYQPTYDLPALSRALDAYQVAQQLADERGEMDVWCAARVGEIFARVGGVGVRVWEEEQERGDTRTPRRTRTRTRRRERKEEIVKAEDEDEDRMTVVSSASEASDYDQDSDEEDAKTERGSSASESESAGEEDSEEEDSGSDSDSELDDEDLDVDEDILSEWDEIKCLSKELLDIAEGYGGTMIALSHLISAILLNPPFQRSSHSRSPLSSPKKKATTRRKKKVSSKKSSSRSPSSSPSKSASTPSTHLLKSKSHLRTALQLATISSDNYLRALILSFIGSHFVYTAPEEAAGMFGIVEQLGSGLGARPKVPASVSAQSTPASGSKKQGSKQQQQQLVAQDAPGNLPLRLYAGKKVLEIYRRAEGEDAEKKMRRQKVFLEGLVRAGAKLEMGSVV
jgi:hypothetical protein